MLAVFPSFGPGIYGGVQATANEAWRSLSGRSITGSGCFCYDPAASKAHNLVRAVRARGNADTVLVWHSALLRLLPLLVTAKHRRVLFLHGIEVWRRQDTLTTFLMRKVDLFLSNSDYTWTRFVSMHPEYSKSAHVTVHLGLGEPIKGHPPAPSHNPVALMVGRLSKAEDYKGHREMIQVWPRVLTQIPDAQLWIVGEGDLRPQLQEMAARLHLADSVRFFGAVPDEQKDALLRQCRALFLPSTGEGFGLVYLEAMRMGRPCLVSTLDAGFEVVNPPEAGLAVRPGDIEDTVDSVVRLLSPGPEWDRMAERALQRYGTQFTARHFEQRLLSALFDA